MDKTIIRWPPFPLLLALFLFIPCQSYAYEYLLPGINNATDSLENHNADQLFPILLNFSLVPDDAWSYAIREVWNDAPQYTLNNAPEPSTWQGVLTWEHRRRSLRLDAAVQSLVSSTPLTVIIEAKSASFVTLIPITIRGALKNLHEYSSVTADYPHIIQSYQSGQTCSNPLMTSSAVGKILNLNHLLPAFVRDAETTKIKTSKTQNILLYPGKKICFLRSLTKYDSLYVKYYPDGQALPAVQTVDIIFVSEHNTVKENVGAKHKQRKHRRPRASSHFGFPESYYSVEIMEEQVPPVDVIKMNTSNNTPATFHMVALMDSRSQTFFTIDAHSGIVRTQAVPDRETISQHHFRITAVSQPDRQWTGTATLHVRILDANDNTPTFEKSDYDVTLLESALAGSVVVTVHAGDGDEGANGQVRYSLINPKGGKNDVFQIDSQTGVITTRLPLDRELTEEHVLYVKAEDEGRGQHKKSSIAKVVVKILDENDNTPTITSNTSCNLDVREDIDWSTMPTIAQVHAEDKDQGLNGQVRYSIIGGNPNGQFILDAVTGDLKVAAQLDYESERRYRLLIRTQDLGSPPRSNTTLCNINIVDMNDNEPKFSTSLYQTNIAEDAHVGYPVVQLRAYDSDEGPKGKILYTIKNQSTSVEMMPFVIDPDSGWITTSTRLDRERKDKYEFSVEAQDMGTPSRSSAASVIIYILDVNDNGPIFEQRDYNVSISEGALPGTQIVTVRATDRDLNARLTYQISGSNDDNRFSIINQNGQGLILLAKPINYRRAQRVELLVQVADESGKNDRTKVTIHILAANLHRPTFLNAPFRIQIPENIPTGTTVIELKATDDDVGDNGRITYTMGSDVEVAALFYLNPTTGVLTVKKPLDREIHSTYTLPVTASDHGAPALYDTTDVLVELIDANDNAPVFPQAAYFVAVKEDVTPHTSITQVSAHDPDFGLNGLVTYTFEGGNSANGTFSIDPALGIVRTTRWLDREIYSTYALIVLAVDRGQPKGLSSSVQLTVKILDVNDNAPAFAAEILNFYAPENLTVGSTIAEILASDPDEGQNSVIEYAIVSGADAESFALVTRPNQQPLLSNLIELDAEGKKHYKLVIRASSPPLQTDVTVNIFVTDINDNAPILEDFHIVVNNYPRHFPHGIIGRVPCFDRDATAQLEYKIMTGNKQSLLSINPSSGDIQLSASLNSDIAYSARFTIQVSDGLNIVTAQGSIKTVPVDNVMLRHSVTIRAANMTSRDLLNEPAYERFIEGIAVVLRCHSEAVYVISIMDEGDASAPEINITVAAKPSSEAREYFSRDYLRERLYVQRTTLYNLTYLEIMPFDDNLCLREPCPNFEKCVSVNKFGKVGRFIVTDSYFFRSVQPVTSFSCECPTGYTGMSVHYSCDTEINLCYSNPCGANGTCISSEGSYHCLCQPGFTGSECEVDLKKTECFDGLCRNPSTCHAGSHGGVHCVDCPRDPYHTDLCKLTTRFFASAKGSYLVFAGIRSRNRFRISLSFATTNQTGLLLYNGRYNENTDYFALELHNGTIYFSFSLGNERQTTKVPVFVADGQWHSVEVAFLDKSAKIKVDGCDEMVAFKHGEELDYQCAATKTHVLNPYCSNAGALCHRFMDLTGPLYVGGVSRDVTDSRILTQHFDGCMQNMRIDEQLLDFNEFLLEHATAAGCPQKSNKCENSPCLNGGTCIVGWEGYKCRCAPGYSGFNCNTREADNSYHFDGNGFITFQPPSNASALSIHLQFRTGKESGTLLIAKISEAALYTLEITRQTIVLHGSVTERHEGALRISDGKWHDLRVFMEENNLLVEVDGKNECQSKLSASQDLATSVVMGGRKDLKTNGFFGCMRDIRLSGMHVLPAHRFNVRTGCDAADAKCDSTVCSNDNSECMETVSGPKCSCKAGYIGKECRDICSLDPCVNGICIHSDEDLHGYRCRCFGNYTGRYYDERVADSCPAAWWGYPVCGPCNCDISKGLDPRCDKQSGACVCRENYYMPVGSDRCEECSCFSRGSLRNECDTSGQCLCRGGVIGLKCDTCSSPYAEVTPDGCETVYGACPQAFADDILWERTPYGSLATDKCPRNALGTASRLCDAGTETWSETVLTNCTGLAFEVPAQLVEEMTDNSKLNTFMVVRMIGELRSALNTTPPGSLFHNDLKVALDALRIVLEYEGRQSGMNLTHRLDKNYLAELLESISLVLTQNGKLNAKQDVNETSLLVHLFHAYSKTIAKFHKETYAESFEIITKYMKMGVVTGLTEYEDSMVRFPPIFPGVPISTQIKTTLPPDSIVYYVEYSDVPEMLAQIRPAKSLQISKTWLPVSKGFIFGKIQEPTPMMAVPALYQFGIIKRKYMGPMQCMHWDFLHLKWSSDGCSTGPVNATHIHCSCLPELLVAVMTENNMLTNPFRRDLTVFLFNIIVFIFAIVLNFVALLLLFATRSQSDLIGVFQNIVFVTIATDVVFVMAADIAWGVFLCKIVAVLLHYFFLSKMFWCLAYAIHVYRIIPKDIEQETGFIRLYCILGYAAPSAIVAFSVGFRPDCYGADNFCWITSEYHLLLTLAVPAMSCGVMTLCLLTACQCRMFMKKNNSSSTQIQKEIRRNLCVGAALCVIFTAVLVAVTVTVVIYLPLLGYIYPLLALGQSIFIIGFLCFKTSEVAALVDEKFVWFMRRNLNSLTSKGKINDKMNNVVCETYRNPGITISDSTTYHRTPRPDKDISCTFDPAGSDSNSTTGLSNQTLLPGEPQNEHNLLQKYTGSQKDSDGTNEETVSVHSSLASYPQEKSPQIAATDLDESYTAFRDGQTGVPNYYRPHSSATTFGILPPPSPWGSLPQPGRTIQKSPTCFSNPVNDLQGTKPFSTFATFKPSSKNTLHVVDGMHNHNGKSVLVRTDLDDTGSTKSETTPIPPPEPFRSERNGSLMRRNANLPDVISCETGTAV